MVKKITVVDTSGTRKRKRKSSVSDPPASHRELRRGLMRLLTDRQPKTFGGIKRGVVFVRNGHRIHAACEGPLSLGDAFALLSHEARLMIVRHAGIR